MTPTTTISLGMRVELAPTLAEIAEGRRTTGTVTATFQRHGQPVRWEVTYDEALSAGPNPVGWHDGRVLRPLAPAS